MSKITYRGDLRTEAVHLKSGNTIITDAPSDNNGKGEAFSPTDLLASSLAACMLTVMGIVAQRHQIELKGTTVDIEKEMVSQPVRRIAKITVVFHMAKGIPSDKKEMLECAAHSCPVYKSLNTDVETPIKFEYPD